MTQANAGPKRPKRGEPRPLEKDVRKAIIELLEESGACVEISHQRGASRKGLSDLYGCYRGFHFRIEVKRDEYAAYHTVTPTQAYNLQRVRRACGWGEVMWNTEQIYTMLNYFDARANVIDEAYNIVAPQAGGGSSCAGSK